MSFSPIQKEVDDRIKTIWVTYFDELTNLGQLMEEVGEMSRVMIRDYGEQSWKQWKEREQLGDEIADVLFVLTCIANQTWVDLNQVWEKWMKKRSTRDKERHKGNEKLTSKIEALTSIEKEEEKV